MEWVLGGRQLYSLLFPTFSSRTQFDQLVPGENYYSLPSNYKARRPKNNAPAFKWAVELARSRFWWWSFLWLYLCKVSSNVEHVTASALRSHARFNNTHRVGKWGIIRTSALRCGAASGLSEFGKEASVKRRKELRSSLLGTRDINLVGNLAIVLLFCLLPSYLLLSVNRRQLIKIITTGATTTTTTMQPLPRK